MTGWKMYRGICKACGWDFGTSSSVWMMEEILKNHMIKAHSSIQEEE